jgi:hypothetical protein
LELTGIVDQQREWPERRRCGRNKAQDLFVVCKIGADHGGTAVALGDTIGKRFGL